MKNQNQQSVLQHQSSNRLLKQQNSSSSLDRSQNNKNIPNPQTSNDQSKNIQNSNLNLTASSKQPLTNLASNTKTKESRPNDTNNEQNMNSIKQNDALENQMKQQQKGSEKFIEQNIGGVSQQQIPPSSQQQPLVQLQFNQQSLNQLQQQPMQNHNIGGGQQQHSTANQTLPPLQTQQLQYLYNESFSKNKNDQQNFQNNLNIQGVAAQQLQQQQDYMNSQYLQNIPQQNYAISIAGNLLPQLDQNQVNLNVAGIQVLHHQPGQNSNIIQGLTDLNGLQSLNQQNQQAFNHQLAQPQPSYGNLQQSYQNQQFNMNQNGNLQQSNQLGNILGSIHQFNNQNAVVFSQPNQKNKINPSYQVPLIQPNNISQQQLINQQSNGHNLQSNLIDNLQALQNQSFINFVQQQQNQGLLLTGGNQQQTRGGQLGDNTFQFLNPDNFQTGSMNLLSSITNAPNQIQTTPSNIQLPITVNLDFSDEKSQNLFIFEQKYNMKKNDCFNLDKQKMALQQQLQQKNEEFDKLNQNYQLLQIKFQEFQQQKLDQLDNNNIRKSSSASSNMFNSNNQQQNIKIYEKIIFDLEESHNEQLNMINHYRQQSEEKTKFSLEVINNSMLAVDLIRKYKDDNKQSLKQSQQNPGSLSSRHPTRSEVEEVEKKIIQCQEKIQKDLIPTDPMSMVRNPLSLKQAKNGTASNFQEALNAGKNTHQHNNLQSLSYTHIYENQASNILGMENRYENALKQPISKSIQTINTPQIIMQNGGVQILNGNNLVNQQFMPVYSRHNFYEIQSVLHNEILLFKQDANYILQEMQKVKEILIMKLTQNINRLFPNYTVDVYGSHATGLCLHWSDIDLVIGQKHTDGEKESLGIGLMQDAKIKDALRRVSDGLRAEIADGWLTNVHYIDQATVPVVKLQCSLSVLMDQAGLKYPKNKKYGSIYSQNFSVDITHLTEFHNGLKCVKLVKEYLLDCWFIEPLILVLKQMLKVNSLNDPYKGGLSSYSLLLMFVAFIQFRELNKVKNPQTINLGNILLDFLLYYGENFHYQRYGITCRKPNDVQEPVNFYTRLPDIQMYNDVPCIDDPLNPQNNVGKSTFQFQDILKVFKTGYQSAFIGCFCDCHFDSQKSIESNSDLQIKDLSSQSIYNNNSMSLRSMPYIQNQIGHPIYTPSSSEQPIQIVYQDNSGQLCQINIENLYVNERIAPQEQCDSILTKIIYSQAQLKAAEENASTM